MNLGDLSKYEVIAVWGAGISFKNWFRKQFHCDLLVDNDMDKIGKSFLGIEIIPPEEFFSLSAHKRVLLVISASRFYGEIEKQARRAGFAGDIVSIEDMSLVHNSDRLSFAQFGIDRFCCDILRKAKFDISDMSFVEIGANHPLAGNQTYLLYLLGARGILVEPNPDLVEVLEKFRSEDVVANCGLGAEEGKLTFYRLDNSYRSSFDKATVNMNLKLGFKLKDKISIPVLSLSSLIEKYDIHPQKTYFSLEIMGLEKKFFEKTDVFSLGFPLIRVADHYGLFDEFDGGSEYVKIASFPRNVIFMNRKVYERMVL